MRIPEIIVAAKHYSQANAVATFLFKYYIDSKYNSLNGPTSTKFIEPWKEYLKNKGVIFYNNSKVYNIIYHKKKAIGININNQKYYGDEIVIAIQHNRIKKLIGEKYMKYCPQLINIDHLDECYSLGIQLFFNNRIDILNKYEQKYIGIIDTPWSILYTVYSDKIWSKDCFDNTDIKQILTITISNDKINGLKIKKKANNCSKDELLEEILYQCNFENLNYHENYINFEVSNGLKFIDENELQFVDDTSMISYVPKTGQYQILENYLHVILPNNKKITNKLNIDNLWLCGEITTDNKYKIPTMEKANESGRKCAGLIMGTNIDPGPDLDYNLIYKIKLVKYIIYIILIFLIYKLKKYLINRP